MNEENENLSLEQIFESGYNSLSYCRDAELKQFFDELTEVEKFDIILESMIPLIQKHSVESLIEFRNNQINKINAIISKINDCNKKKKLGKIVFKRLQRTLNDYVEDIASDIVNLLRYVNELYLSNEIIETERNGFMGVVEINRFFRDEILKTGNNKNHNEQRKAGNKREFNKDEFLNELAKIPKDYKKTATSIGKFFNKNESVIRENFKHHFGMTVREYYKNS